MGLKEAIAIALEYLDLAHGYADDDNPDHPQDLAEARKALEAYLENQKSEQS